MDDTMKLNVKLESGLTHHVVAKPLTNAQLVALQMLGKVKAETQSLLIRVALQTSLGEAAFAQLLVGMMDLSITDTDFSTVLNEIVLGTAKHRGVPDAAAEPVAADAE